MKKKLIVLISIGLLLTISVIPSGGLKTKEPSSVVHAVIQKNSDQQSTAQVLCYVAGKKGVQHNTITLTTETATELYTKFHQLKDEMTLHPFSETTQYLKNKFIELLIQHSILPRSIPLNEYTTLLNPPWYEHLKNNYKTPSPSTSPTNAGTGVAALCSIASEGTGILFPFIMLPRPRLLTVWAGIDGITSVGKLTRIGGFLAGGTQFGTAFGFWGIGLSFAFPYGNLYGFVGYALWTTVTAEYIEHYPPNNPPEITSVDPINGQEFVPLSTSELRFQINDADNDLMSYTVTTDPDIGSGSGDLKPGGVYSVPVSDLESLTKYTWHIQVTDREDVTEQTFIFITEPIAPVISNPIPADKERDIYTDLTQLRFTLKDFQGDTMDYMVETSPNIGSSSANNVPNGTYVVPIKNLLNGTEYRWFINVTDGEHWTRARYSFQTGWYPGHFNPFDLGWHYRKLITIDHTQVSEALTYFPILIKTIDHDLRKNAQEDGSDILFMNNTGIAEKLYHDVESYNSATGELIAWVNLPKISSSQDTTFYMYYGNSTCIDLEKPQKTWDNHYVAVWHMNDLTVTTIDESTSHNHPGIKQSQDNPAETSNGKIGKAQNFISADYISCPDNDDFSMIDGFGDVPFTLELWMYPTQINNHHNLLSKDAKSQREWNFQYYGYPSYQRFISITLHDNVNGKTIWGSYDYDFQPNMWYYCTVTYDGAGSETGLHLFFNGKPTAWTKTQNGGYIKMSNTDSLFSMGKYDFSDPKYYYGYLDEIRISKGIARSAGWFLTNYNNQNDPASFLNIGPEEPGP